MRASPAHTRLIGWFAIAAILLASLAPSMSHALGSSGGSLRAEVCTAQGSKWVDVGADSSTSSPAESAGFEHCPYCSLHVPVLGLPTSSAALCWVLGGQGKFPPAF